jgi:hypothetical protein
MAPHVIHRLDLLLPLVSARHAEMELAAAVQGMEPSVGVVVAPAPTPTGVVAEPALVVAP